MKKVLALFSILFLYSAGTSADVPASVSNSIHSASSVETYKAFKEGEVLVKFKQETRSASAQRIHQAAGARFMRRVEGSQRLELIKLESGISTIEAVNYYRSNPEVEYAEPNYRRRIAATPNDPGFSLQWGLTKINAPAAWDISTGGNVTIAILDTGINYNHPDLSANIWNNPEEPSCASTADNDGNGYVGDCRGWNFVSSNNAPLDDEGHGSHVSGIIGAVGNNNIGISGVMWNVKLMPLKILDSWGNGFISDEVEAIHYAIAKKAKVINFSLTGPDYSQSEFDAINAAKNAGILVVAAAGNDGANNDKYPQYPANYNLNNIISVAALNSSDSLAPISNFGSSVHIAAPGVNIYSINLYGYESLSGTSMAAPFVSGLAGLLFSRYPNYNYLQVRSAIVDNGDVIETLSGLVSSSARINVHKALSSGNSTPSSGGGGGCSINPSVKSSADASLLIALFFVCAIFAFNRKS